LEEDLEAKRALVVGGEVEMVRDNGAILEAKKNQEGISFMT
jgi:hypothetical protein